MAENTTGFKFTDDPSSPNSDVNATNLNNAVEKAVIRKIAPNAINSDHLNSTCAGAGLGGGGGSALYVKTDADSIEINNDALRLKEGGIKAKHIASGSITNDKLSTEVQNTIKDILKTIYKVGDYFITHNAENPATRFGGQWELVKNRFLIGAGGKYNVLSQGGAETHTLTAYEMPSHSHSSRWNASEGGKNTGPFQWGLGPCSANVKFSEFNAPINNTGGSQPHNNMPPYRAVYIWCKISDLDAEEE